MNKTKFAQAKRFGAASVAAAVVITGSERPAEAQCAGASLIQDTVEITQWLTDFDGAWDSSLRPINDGSSSGGYYMTIPSHGIYGLRTNETSVTARVYYYSSGNQIAGRGCRVGTTSTSFSCASTQSATAPFSSTTVAWKGFDLDAIASASNSVSDFYVLDVWGPNGNPALSGAYVRGVRFTLGKDTAWEGVLGESVDLCLAAP